MTRKRILVDFSFISFQLAPNMIPPKPGTWVWVSVCLIFLTQIVVPTELNNEVLEGYEGANVSLDARETSLVSFEDRDRSFEPILSRVKRGFGGKEPINFTLIHQNVLGAPAWMPLICGATMDMVFRVSSYTVLGSLKEVLGHSLELS
jgi:hypothetical protein